MTLAATPSLDVEHLRSWIGREEAASDTVSADLVAKFRATFDLPDEGFRVGDIAPRLIHLCLAQPAVATAMLGPDGHPERGGFLPPVPLPRRMWAGGSIAFHGDLHVGDTIWRVSRILDVVPKDGRSGLLCFVTVEHLIEVGGCPVVRETQDIVYRGPSGEASPTPAVPAETGAWHRRLEVSATLMFRYSALTFNGHRIHYDRRYAIAVESYPGLVVHGPLQATLLFNYATEIRGAPPSRFTFRSLSPLFDDSAFVLHANDTGTTLHLWTAREGGPVAMTAEAEWQ